MSIERTQEVMNRYWDSDHKDVSMMADDVVFTHMASGDEHRGPDEVRRMLDYMYRQAFKATAEIRTRVCTEDHAMIEADFVGTHTGEFAGIPATGRQVKVPFCAVYDLAGRSHYPRAGLHGDAGHDAPAGPGSPAGGRGRRLRLSPALRWRGAARAEQAVPPHRRLPRGANVASVRRRPSSTVACSR